MKFSKSLPGLMALAASIFLSLSCGGQFKSSPAPEVVLPADLKPSIHQGKKWVYKYTSDGEVSRQVREVTQVASGLWREVNMSEGIQGGISETHFQVSEGVTYSIREFASSYDKQMEAPGRRAFVPYELMPTVEEYVLLDSRISSGFPFNYRETFTANGRSEESFQGQSVSTYSFTKLLGIFATVESLEINTSTSIYSDTFGALHEQVSRGTEVIAQIDLVEFIENAGEGFLFGPSSVSKLGSPTQLTFSSKLAQEKSEAVIREIYTISQNHPECRKDFLKLELAHACHLYHHYYLYKDRLPSSLEGIEEVPEYVDRLRVTDPFTFYLSPASYKQIIDNVRGDRATIGLVFENKSGQILSAENPFKIDSVVPLSRAWRDDIRSGDLIQVIDGKSVGGLTYSEARALLPSREDQGVAFTLLRGSTTLEVETAAENVMSELYADKSVYLSLRSYSTNSADLISEELDKMIALAGGNIQKLILDLRYNGGGSLTGALELVDYLIEKNLEDREPMLINETADKKFILEEEFSKNANIPSFEKFVLLINQDSASASEITAAAIKHYHAATLMGETSFGKGVGQVLLELVDGSGLAVTRYSYLDPGGVTFHDVGVSPDMRISTEPTSVNDDFQLMSAKQWLDGLPITTSPSSKARFKPVYDESVDPMFKWIDAK